MNGLPSYGFFVRSAKRVMIEDIRISPAKADARPLIFLAEPTEDITADGGKLERAFT